jgi:hypothetical protein
MTWWGREWEIEKRTNHKITEADIWEDFKANELSDFDLFDLLDGDPRAIEKIRESYDNAAQHLLSTWEEDRAEDKLLERKQGPIEYGALIR